LQICSGTVRARRHTTSGLRLFSGDLPRPCRRLAAAVPELHRVRYSPHDPRADCCDRSSWEHRLDDLHPSGHEHPAECHVDDHGRSDQDHRRLVGHSGQKLHRHAAPPATSRNDKSPGITAGASCLATQLYIAPLNAVGLGQARYVQTFVAAWTDLIAAIIRAVGIVTVGRIAVAAETVAKFAMLMAAI